MCQHVPVNIRFGNLSLSFRMPQSEYDSTIGQHLLDSPDCASIYVDSFFTVFHGAQSAHCLRGLEAVYIKLYQPDVFKQNEGFSVTPCCCLQSLPSDCGTPILCRSCATSVQFTKSFRSEKIRTGVRLMLVVAEVMRILSDRWFYHSIRMPSVPQTTLTS